MKKLVLNTSARQPRLDRLRPEQESNLHSGWKACGEAPARPCPKWGYDISTVALFMRIGEK